MYRLALILLFAFALSTHAQLVPKEAVPEKVADGYKFTEGPALGPDGNIYFTDIPASLILRYDPVSGQTVTAYENTRNTNGLMFHRRVLYGCSHGMRGLVQWNKPRSPIALLTSLLDSPDKPQKNQRVQFNSPNDLIFDKQGGIYFTDPRYGNRDDMEMKTEGVYYFSGPRVDPGGDTPVRLPELMVIDADLTRPNGIVLSPDESILYVADHGANWIYAYDIKEPGKVENKRKFAQLNDGEGRGSDGMTVDAHGRLYATGHGKVWIFEPTGELVATIDVGKQTTNCTFGADGKTLYITANKGLYRITLNTDSPLQHAEKD